MHRWARALGSNAGFDRPALPTTPHPTVNALAPCALSSRPATALGLALLILIAALAGCAAPTSRPGGGTPTSPAGPAGTEPAAGLPSARPAPPAPVSPLVTEQRWLDEWFRGTPVVIALADHGTLQVEVPLANSFDAGSNALKPALVAVLDRVATSLRRQATLRVSVAAPTDAGGAAALAGSRTQRVREHLVSRGVAAVRVAGGASARAGAPVQLRMVIAPQPIARLNDASLPVPVMGVKPVAASSPKR